MEKKDALRLAAVLAGLLVLGGSTGGCGSSSVTGMSGPAAPVFRASVRISDNTDATAFIFDSSGRRSLFVSGDNVYAAWVDDRTGSRDVWFTRSTDGGRSFSANLKINTDSTAGTRERVVVTADGEGNVFIVWADDRSGNGDIFIATSGDWGAGFSPEMQVSTDTSGAQRYEPSVRSPGDGKVLVTWVDLRAGSPEIYLAGSVDHGASFNVERPLFAPNPFAYVTLPSLDVDGNGRIFVVSEARIDPADESAIYVARLDNVSVPSAGYARVDDAPDSVGKTDPTMAVSEDGHVFVAWNDRRNGMDKDVYFSRSLDNGVTYSPSVRLNTTSTDQQDLPSLATNAAGVVFVAWRDSRDGASHVYGVKSTDGGATFAGDFRIDDGGADSQADVNVALDKNGKCLAAWSDSRTPSGIYFRAEN